jgi:hypothetical protein
MKSYFYIITNIINNKTYYGSGSKKNYFGSGVALHNAIIKHGKENFTMTILKEFTTREDAFMFEDRFLKLYKVSSLHNTYNIKDSAEGGDTITHNPNKELIKKKMSDSAIETNYIRGKTYEEIHGIEKTKIIKAKLKYSHIGIKQTDETKNKRKISLKERWSDANTKETWLINNVFINNNPSKTDARKKQMSIDRMGENNPAAKKIEINGKIYGSIIEASRELKISRSTIQRKLKTNTEYKLINN